MAVMGRWDEVKLGVGNRNISELRLSVGVNKADCLIT